MQGPRLTIGQVMMATLILAADIAVVRAVFGGDVWHNSPPTITKVVGPLPMLTLLVLGLGRRRWTPAAVGFQTAGWGLVALFAAAAVLYDDLIFRPLQVGFVPFAWAAERLGLLAQPLKYLGPFPYPFLFEAIYVHAAVTGTMVGLSWLAGRLSARYWTSIDPRESVVAP